MIQPQLTKILFFDLETIGITKDFDELSEKYPELKKQFLNYFDWFIKRFPEDKDLDPSQIFVNRAALVPEFSRIVCASFAFVTSDGKIHKQTFADKDEKKLLRDINDLMNKVFKLDFWLCGHNIKMFDIPMLLKRMVIHGIKPSPLLPNYDTKPWEIKAVDTLDIWRMGNNFGLASLELMCAALGIPSPKEGEVTGNRVHEAYYDYNQLDLIVEYCERDVLVLIDVIKKFKELQ